jgi:hypothetical protein
MKNSFKLIIPALLSITLYGCDDRDASYKKRQLKIVSQIELGQSPSYWLYKHTGFGSTGFQRVGLIYGFAYDADRGGMYDGNKIFCEDIITLYAKMYPNAVYKCDVAN